MALGIVCDDPSERTIRVECLTCGRAFSYQRAPGVKGRKRRYCSDGCKAAAIKIKAVVYKERYRADGRYAGRYKPNPSWPSRQPGAHKPKLKPHICKVCEKAFESVQSKATCCSRACTRAHLNGAPGRYQAEQKALGLSFECPECNVRFYKRRSYQVFCSIVCTRRSIDRIHNRARRGRYLAGTRVDPKKVFERDGWKCRGCRRSSPWSLRGTTDPRAPTLDHIQSVADGGEHSYRNVQLLCFECNMRKGRRSGGQLHLFS